MATRYYLPSTGEAAVSPAYDAAWDQTGQADRLRCVTTKISSAMTNKGAMNSGTTTILWRQYVSDPIGPQTITGTVKAQVRGRSNEIGPAALGIRVVSNDGATVRGTLLAVADYTGTLLTGALRNKTFADGDTVTSVVAQNNDRLVFEFGNNQTLATADPTGNFGDNSGTDLPEDETTTAAYNPWVELSMTLAGPLPSVSVADALTLIDALALKTGKVITDGASLADVVSTVLKRTVSISESLAIIDALALKTGKSITDAVSLQDAVSTSVAVFNGAVGRRWLRLVATNRVFVYWCSKRRTPRQAY